MQVKVIKADGSTEVYMHTKVLATINNALCLAGAGDVRLAEELSEVVTYFLYERGRNNRVSSGEILSVIKAVLSSTGNEQAAEAIAEHHRRRKMQRSRTEVVGVDIKELSDAQSACEAEQEGQKSGWDKSRIVEHLVDKYGLCRQTSRTIAGMVEQKVLDMGARVVPASLVRQLVLNDTAAVLHAQQQLQPA